MNGKKSSLKGGNYLTIYKETGSFYYTRGIDAYILSNLLGYKVIKNKCGFPDVSLDKVLDVFRREKITYEIVHSDKSTSGLRFKFNTYKKHYQHAKQIMHIEKKVEQIEERLQKADIKILEGLLDLIDGVFK